VLPLHQTATPVLQDNLDKPVPDVKPFWTLLQQEVMELDTITTGTRAKLLQDHHNIVFYRLDALPVAQPTA